MTTHIASDQDCANRALVAAIFADHLGNSAAANALCDVAAVLSARRNPLGQDFPPRVESRPVDEARSVHFVRNLLTIHHLPSEPLSQRREARGWKMSKHKWLHLELSEMAAYAAIHQMHQVSRYLAEALCAVDFQMYEDEKRVRLSINSAARDDLVVVACVVGSDSTISRRSA